jgi:hypothetical protein
MRGCYTFTITFLVALLALTSVPSSWAECAWLLWDDVGPQFGTINFKRTAAYDSRSSCLKAAETRAKRIIGEKIKVYEHADGTLIWDNGKTMMHAQCWPENLAPANTQR